MYTGVLQVYIRSLAGIAPHSDIISLGCSVTCTFLALPFFTAEMFLGQVSLTSKKTSNYYTGECLLSIQQYIPGQCMALGIVIFSNIIYLPFMTVFHIILNTWLCNCFMIFTYQTRQCSQTMASPKVWLYKPLLLAIYPVQILSVA